MLIQFSTNTLKMLYVRQVEERVAFTYKVKGMQRRGETSQLAFSDKDSMSETEGENNVAKLS